MGGGGVTRKEIDQWNTWGPRTSWQISLKNDGISNHTFSLYNKLQLTISNKYKQQLQQKDLKKQKTAQTKASHPYKQRQAQLQRNAATKRKARTLTAKEQNRDYKNSKQRTQALDFEMDIVNKPLFRCEVPGCTHKKGFATLGWLKRHIDVKHNSK